MTGRQRAGTLPLMNMTDDFSRLQHQLPPGGRKAYSVSRRALVTILAAALACATNLRGDGTEEEGVFLVNGKPVSPQVLRVSGDGVQPAAGDVALIEGRQVVLRKGPKYEFVSDVKDRERLWLMEGGQKRLVALGVGSRSDPGGNALLAMSEEEITGLWGIVIQSWDDAAGAKLARLDLKQTLVTFKAGIQAGRDQRLPELASKLAYVVVEQNSSPGLSDLSGLARAKDLIFLQVQLMAFKPDQGFNPNLIAASQELKYLSVWGIKDAAWPMPGFGRLHTLSLAWNRELRELSFLTGMPNLETLDLNHTGVQDLSVLEKLQHLRELKAEAAPVHKLPSRPLKTLKTARLIGSQLSAQEVAKFVRLNPQAEVWHGWQQALARAAKPVTWARIRTGGTCHRNLAQERTLAEVRDAARIKILLEAIDINEPQSGSHCMCCGDPAIELYAGDKLVMMLGIHHGQSLRWPDGWPGDALLTPRGAAALRNWLAANGGTGPQN